MKLGIDLGTYNSSAALALDRKNIVMVESRSGRALDGKHFPSFVLFDHHGEKVAVGKTAKNEFAHNPELVVWGAKRLVGLSYQQAQADGELNRFKYAIEEGENGGILIRVGPRRYSPQQILRFILEEIKTDAEDPHVNPLTGGTEFNEAVITIPAYFKAWRTQAIIEAATADGLFAKVETLAEPTGAAMRYGTQIDNDACILAFDMGAGTLDVTVLDVMRNGDELLAGELCVSGHEAFGGIDIDSILVQYLREQNRLPDDPWTSANLQSEVERAKIRLSRSTTAEVELPNGRSISLTRAQLDELLVPVLRDRCRGPIRKALEGSGRKANELDHVIFVGGPTHMPCVRHLVRDELKALGASRELLQRLETPSEQASSVDPMDCVAQGAALKAADVIVPAIQTIAEGYGTILGSNCYGQIIPTNASYPIVGAKAIVACNSSAKRVPVALVAKTPDTRRSDSVAAFRYEQLGFFSLAISPTGEPPVINVELKIDENKIVQAKLTHMQSGLSAVYRALNLLAGTELALTEDSGPAMPPSDPLHSPSTTTPPAQWTGEELHLLIHTCRAVMNLAGAFSDRDAEVKKEVGTFRASLETVARKCIPSQHAPLLWNGAQTLLALLLQKKLIEVSDYRAYKTSLDGIVR